MLKRRSFHIGEILSVVIGYNLSQSGPRGYIALLDFLSGRRLTPEERFDYLPQAREEVKQQYPELFYFTVDDIPCLELEPEWLRRRQFEFGEYLEIVPALKHSEMPRTKSGEAMRDPIPSDQRPLPVTADLQLSPDEIPVPRATLLP